MQEMRCFLCRKADKECVNIQCKWNNHSPEDIILDICGTVVKKYLDQDDLICVDCVHIIQNAFLIKRQIFDLVCKNGADRVLKRGKSQDPIAQDLDDGRISPDDYEANSPSSYSASSPNNLLVIKSSIPFDKRPSYKESDRNNYNKTPKKIHFRDGRRRHRGHNFTRRKGSSSRSRSRSQSTNQSRSQSRVSNTSTQGRSSRTSTTSRDSRSSSLNKKRLNQQYREVKQKHRILKDFLSQDGSLGQFASLYLERTGQLLDGEALDYSNSNNDRPVIKTRFATRLQDKLLSAFENHIFQCPLEGCHFVLFNLEEYTEHRVKEHNEMALFWCEQCKFNFISQEDLEKHEDLKHTPEFFMYCIFCAEEFHNKRLYQNHLDEHLIHSFPCIYCDKFFLNKQICDNHIREQHPGRKRKIKRIKPQSILVRIDKNNSEFVYSDMSNTSSEFVVKILEQHARTEEQDDTNIDKDILTSSECSPEMVEIDTDAGPPIHTEDVERIEDVVQFETILQSAEISQTEEILQSKNILQTEELLENVENTQTTEIAKETHQEF